MKNLKFIGLSLVLAAMAFLGPIASHAQLRTKTLAVTQGNTAFYGNINPAIADSLQVSDSIAYLVSVSHTNAVDPFLQWEWTKVGAGTATITLAFLQSNDNVNWFAVPKGAAQTAYTKSYTISASGWQLPVSFAQDTARFEGKYLKIYYITSATASVNGKLYGILKTSIK